MCPRPPPSSAHRARTVIGYGPEIDYTDLTIYVTGTVESKKKDIGVKFRDFGVYTRDQTEIGQK